MMRLSRFTTGTYLCALVLGVGFSVHAGALEVFGPPDMTAYDTAELLIPVQVCGGERPYTYEWHKNGTVLPPAQQPNGPDLVIASPTTADSGTYSCRVTDSGQPPAVQDSVPGQVTVRIYPRFTVQPPSVDLVQGEDHMFPLNCIAPSLSFLELVKDGVTIFECEIRNADASDAGSYQFRLMDTVGNSVLSSPATVTVLSLVSAPVGGAPPLGGPWSFSVSTSGGNGQPLSYQWMHDGTPVGTNSPVYTIASVAETDRGVYNVQITQQASARPLVSQEAILNIGGTPLILGSQPASQKVYYTAGNVFFSTSVVSGGITPYLYQWEKNTGSGFAGIPGATQSAVAVQPVYGSDAAYRCLINDSSTPIPQRVLTDSVDLDIYAPVDYFLMYMEKDDYCAADEIPILRWVIPPYDGIGRLHYQWSVNGMPVPGMTTLSLVLPVSSCPPDGYAILSCRVWDDGGSQATVDDYIYIVDCWFGTIWEQPIGAVVPEGAAHTFSVLLLPAATTHIYQWQFNYGSGFTPIPGATTSALTLDPVAACHSGSYYCAITDTYTPEILKTDPAVLEVYPALELVAEPAGSAIGEGESHQFQVEASGGTGTLHFRWYRDNMLGGKTVEVAGTDSPTLVITNAHRADAGYYWVEVSDDFNTITTERVFLEVGEYGLPAGRWVAFAALVCLILACGGSMLAVKRLRT